MKKDMKGFTLAETLITLAIIGVVAALTIPTLVQSYKKRVVETKLPKFYSMINQALDLSEVDNGDRLFWDTLNSFCEFEDNEDNEDEPKTCAPGTEDALVWYNTYLAKYIKVLKVETGMDMSYSYVNNTHPSDVILYFHDGSALQFSGRGWNYYINAKDVVKNGRPEHWGTIAFPFKLNSKMKLEPYAATDSGFNFDCSKDGNGAYCTGVIAENGWKIPDDYPYKF